MNVLAVDDDPETLSLLARALSRAGFQVRVASSSAAALAAVTAARFDVIVLDVMMPDGSGLALCASLRRLGLATPILFLSARGTVAARVEGLDAGADDYLPKPFAVRELVARVRALARRGPALRPQRVDVGRARVDLAARRVERDGQSFALTAREGDVLDVLVARAGVAVSYEELLESAWGEASERARASLDVIITRLRKKLDRPGEETVLRNVRGVGYVLSGTRAPAP